MFKKQPVIVQTIRMLQNYCGPATPSPDPKVAKNTFKIMKASFGEASSYKLITEYVRQVKKNKEMEIT